MPNEKRCTKCGQTKVLAEFTRRSKSEGGYKSHCKVCMRDKNNAAQKKWREAHPELWRERNRRNSAKCRVAYRYLTEEKKAQARAYHKAYYYRDHDRKKLMHADHTARAKFRKVLPEELLEPRMAMVRVRRKIREKSNAVAK